MPSQGICSRHHPRMTLRRYKRRKLKEMQPSPIVAEYRANPLRMGISRYRHKTGDVAGPPM
jgi:hypothetical protein